MAQLPPIGQATDTSEAEIIQYIGFLALEGAEARSPWESSLDANENTYTYGDENGPPDDGKITINEIQNAVVAATDIQTKEPPTATLEPVETGEPPLYYWAGPPEATMPFVALGLLQPFEVDQWMDDYGQLQPPTPLDPLIAGELKAMAVPEEVSPALPPGFIRPDWVVAMDDKLIADTFQIVFDVFWERCDAEKWIRKNLHDCNIWGWNFGLYEFDDTALTHVLRHLPLLQTYIDPTCADIAEASYAGFDLPLDASEARALYPDFIDVIDAEAKDGYPDRPDSQTVWSDTYNRNFRREMISLRVFWLRNQLVPMGKDEAVGLGLVAEVGYGDEQQQEPTVPVVRGAVAPDSPTGAEALGGGAGDTGELSSVLQPAERGEPAADGAGAGICILIATGQPIQPGDVAAGWPTRLGIRQITQLGQTRIVDDRESESFDIPILHNVNIPLPGLRPWGLGEPYRLKAIQKAESTLMTAMVEHAKYFASPVSSMSQSMHDALPPEYKDASIKPGLTIVVPDEQWMAVKGQVQNVQDPPPLSPAHAELFPMLKQLIQEQSGHSEVLQGRSGSAKSGTAIDMLQTAASSMIGFKAQRTGDMVKRLSKLMLHSLVWRLDVDDVERIVSKYPRHVLEAIHQRARQIEWNVKVVVQAGNGGLNMQKRQLAEMDLQVGAISLEGYREKAGIDSRLEDQRIEAQMQKQARLMGAGMGQEQGEQPGEKKPQQGPPGAAQFSRG
jgi:hypothetical protein